MSGEVNAIFMVVDGSTNSTNITKLMKYTEYTVMVRANTTVCGGDWSNTVTVVTNEDGN